MVTDTPKWSSIQKNKNALTGHHSTDFWRTFDEFWPLNEHRAICLLSHISNNCIIRNSHKESFKTSNVKCYFKGSTLITMFIRSHNQGRRPYLLESARICDMGLFFNFLEQIVPPWRHISTRIHAQVVGSRVEVAMLRDHMMRRVARFSCGFFIVLAEWDTGRLYVGRIVGRWNKLVPAKRFDARGWGELFWGKFAYFQFVA